MADTRVRLGEIELKNPVIPASGTFGYGREFAELFDLNILGGIAVKGTTIEAKSGNESPRIAEAAGGMINSVGLQNPGAANVATEQLPGLAEIFDGVIIANISGFSERDYAACAEIMDSCPQAHIVEVNISCPNVHGGGMAFGQSSSQAAVITKAVKAVTRKPVYIKLSPNVTDIAEIASACEAAGADGISLINTLQVMRIDIKTRKPVLANITGGLSGPAIFPVALRMVNQVRKAVDIPIMGMGGIASAEDVIEMIMAGADAVQIGAAGLRNPWIYPEITEQLPQLMEQLGINNLKEVKGIV